MAFSMTASLFPRTARMPAWRLQPLAFAAGSLFAGAVLAQPAAPGNDALPTIEVSSGAEASVYSPEESAGAKTLLPQRELPQSVRTITRQALDDLGTTRLDTVLDYVSGVSRQQNFGGIRDNPTIRGLPGGDETAGTATLLNGFSAGRGITGPRDLASVERIEFLKGTAAALYGSSEPGGTLNVVSKRPLWAPAHSVQLMGGGRGYRRGALDLSGPVGERFAYRLNAAVERSDGFRDHGASRREVLAPAFTWKLGRDTSLEYVGELLRQRAPFDRGVLAIGDRLGAVPVSRFLGEPADGDLALENQSHQLMLSHDWNAQWRSRVGLSWRRASMQGFASEAHALRSDGLLTRQRRYRDSESDDLALQAELVGHVRTGSVEHELLFGLERFRFEVDTTMLRINPTAARPYAIHPFAPGYGQPQPVPGPNTRTFEQQSNTAFYVQDAITLAPAWRLVAGLRVDNYRQSLLNLRNGRTERQTPSATSPRIGLSWLPTPQWTLYANAGRSFRPNVGADVAARAFAPETGRAFELGSKWESADRRLGATAALFHIRKRNVLTGDPANPGFSMAAGEMRSRGLELDFSGQLSTHWRLLASATYTDAAITADRTFEVGGRLLNVPRVQASAMAFYEDALANGQRYGIGAGLTHVGRRLGQARTQAEALAGTSAFDLPGYTTARLAGWWQLSPALRLTLDVDNLFDKDYYPSSYSRLWVAPGEPRSVRVGLTAQF